jgi:hypothetical protein
MWLPLLLLLLLLDWWGVAVFALHFFVTIDL